MDKPPQFSMRALLAVVTVISAVLATTLAAGIEGTIWLVVAAYAALRAWRGGLPSHVIAGALGGGAIYVIYVDVLKNYSARAGLSPHEYEIEGSTIVCELVVSSVLGAFGGYGAGCLRLMRGK